MLKCDINIKLSKTKDNIVQVCYFNLVYKIKIHQFKYNKIILYIYSFNIIKELYNNLITYI